MGVMDGDGLQEDGSQLLRIGVGHAQGGGEPKGFVFPLVMQGIQAVVAQLAKVHHRSVGMRDKQRPGLSP